MKMVKQLVMALSLVLPLSACAWGAGGGGGFYSAGEATRDGNTADRGNIPNQESSRRALTEMQSWLAAAPASGGVQSWQVPASGARAGGGSVAMAVTVSPKLVKGTYIGASVAAPDPVLRAQLKLPAGVGLVVANVDAEGPAKAGGLRETDVIQKIDDQWAINAAQFEVLVRMHKPGDKVELTAIREAQPVKVTVTLVERDVPDLAWVTSQGQGTGGGGSFRGASPVRFTTTPDGAIHIVGENGEGAAIFRRASPTTRPAPATPKE
jgi:hypothetical protein